MVVGILGGITIDVLGMERFVENYVWKIRMGQAEETVVDNSLRGRVAYGCQQVREIVGRVCCMC
jgi:hypothetical protein